MRVTCSRIMTSSCAAITIGTARDFLCATSLRLCCGNGVCGGPCATTINFEQDAEKWEPVSEKMTPYQTDLRCGNALVTVFCPLRRGASAAQDGGRHDPVVAKACNNS